MEGSNRTGSQADQSRGLPLRTIAGVVDPHTIRHYVRMLVNMGIVIRQIVRWVRWFQIVPLVDESPIRMFSKPKR